MTRPRLVKSCSFLLGFLLIAGCASSTVESRRREKAAVFSSLPADQQAAVMHGRIGIGMSSDAVYIAIGSPDQVLEAQDQSGSATVWLYHSTWMQEEVFWNSRDVNSGNRPYREQFLDRDYVAREYVALEITFVGGHVVRWRNLPRPM